MFQAKPRKIHLEVIKRVWGYLKQNPYKGIFVNYCPTKFSYLAQDVNISHIKDIYIEAIEVKLLSRDMDDIIGEAHIWAYVNAVLNSDERNGIGCTGVVIMAGQMPIVYLSKMQGSVECSTYRSEFSRIKICIEEVLGIRAMIREIGFYLGTSRILCDNAGDITASTNV